MRRRKTERNEENITGKTNKEEKEVKEERRLIEQTLCFNIFKKNYSDHLVNNDKTRVHPYLVSL